MAESFMANCPASRTGGDRYQIVVNVDAGVLEPIQVITGGIEQRNRAAGIEVEPSTVMPRWYGDALDLDHITTALWCVDQRGRPSGN
jgi:hypothetical protein